MFVVASGRSQGVARNTRGFGEQRMDERNVEQSLSLRASRKAELWHAMTEHLSIPLHYSLPFTFTRLLVPS